MSRSPESQFTATDLPSPFNCARCVPPLNLEHRQLMRWLLHPRSVFMINQPHKTQLRAHTSAIVPMPRSPRRGSNSTLRPTWGATSFPIMTAAIVGRVPTAARMGISSSRRGAQRRSSASSEHHHRYVFPVNRESAGREDGKRSDHLQCGDSL